MELNHKHHIILTVSIVAVLFIIILLMISPAMKGYQITKEFKKYDMDVGTVFNEIESSKMDLEILGVKYDSSQELNEEYAKEIKRITNDSYSNFEEQQRLQTMISLKEQEFKNNISSTEMSYNNQIATLNAELTQTKNELNELKTTQNNIIKNSANNICCKYKVDYPSTDSYVVSNSRIVCTTGEKNIISC